MTSSSALEIAVRSLRLGVWWLLLGTWLGPAWAGLGEQAGNMRGLDIDGTAHHSTVSTPRYTVHILRTPNGIRTEQYVDAAGVVFAVRWSASCKPDLSPLLGPSYPAYRSAVQAYARRAGLQRQFRHDDRDLVVSSSVHLNQHSGYAFRRSLLPAGLNPQELGWE